MAIVEKSERGKQMDWDTYLAEQDEALVAEFENASEYAVVNAEMDEADFGEWI